MHDAISDLVELIKTFQSKNKLSQLFLSTLFKRRQDELDAVVDRAIMRLQVSSVSPFSRSFRTCAAAVFLVSARGAGALLFYTKQGCICGANPPAWTSPSILSPLGWA